jgi:molybdopterin guanine dinucleotide-containing S/N-oxide reductase-like protein
MTRNLVTKVKGEKTYYSSCNCNCGSDSHCVFKVHLKDGIVVAVEPDDRYNPGAGREDEGLPEAELLANHLQRRMCVRGMAFHKHLNDPRRVIYPLKRAPGARRGEGKFVRISWDEALDTIANKMIEIRQKYGPYSIIIPKGPNGTAERLFSFWGAGVNTWGYSSADASRIAVPLMFGVDPNAGTAVGGGDGGGAGRIINSKLIVIWGYDPAMGSGGPGYQFAWFLKLARERGGKVIIFDPRYTPAAEATADQWIPIKPGTDCAMFMAMAYVLFEEDSWNKEFVARYVEPKGFEEWKNYVLGVDDGVKKTPEWAEGICAVPAETIRGLIHLAQNTRQSMLYNSMGVFRKSHGENTVRAFTALQAMRGALPIPGAGPAKGPRRTGNLAPRTMNVSEGWGPLGDYHVPILYRGHYWNDAIVLLDKVRSGELSEKDYMRMVGWRDDPAILKDFNPKMLFWGGESQYGGNHLATQFDSPAFQVPAMEKMEFIVSVNSMITCTARYADIILPAQDWMWEEMNIVPSGGATASINLCVGLAKPPGEVKPRIWMSCKLAEKLGVDPHKFFPWFTSFENWDKDWERYQKDTYQDIVERYAKAGITLPTWEEFVNGKFINCDELTTDRPYEVWGKKIDKDKPFRTESGKIEFYSRYLADESNRGKGMHYDAFGSLYQYIASDWGSLTPKAIYKEAVRGINDPMVKQYPLLVITPPGRYRVHSLFWTNPWLKDQVYQHRIWISITDAKARGIKDGDMITAYNDRGKVVMKAYVTARIMPGIIAVRSGAWYEPDASGVDFGATAASLLGGDYESCITPAKAVTLAQVEKYKGELP